MNGPRKSEVELFTGAVRLPLEERAVFLAACNVDAELRGRVEALLRAFTDAGEFLEEIPAEVKTAIATPGEKIGNRIGRYKLLQQIGEGGCGMVYMADQARRAKWSQSR